MPGGDRTGPLGRGARTGRGTGWCAGTGAPGYVSDGPGFGFRTGFGMGLFSRNRGAGGGGGRRNRFYSTGLPGMRGWRRSGSYASPYGPVAPEQKPDPGIEKQALSEQARFLRSELDAIEKRLSAITTEPSAG